MDGTGCANIGFNVVAADTAASVPQCRTCIFDLDGLLLATEQLYTEAANQILEDYDCPKMDLRIKAKLMGQSGLKANEIFVKECKLPLTAEQALKRNHELLATKFESVKPMTGALELIAHLASNKVPIAVATSSTQANLNCKRKGNSELFNYFKDMIVTGDDIAKLGLRGKPAPDIYLEALKKINDRDGTDIKPEECLCFEDSVSGIKSVLSAKMQPIWVPDPEIYKIMNEEEQRLTKDNRGEIVDSLLLVDLAKYGLPKMVAVPDSQSVRIECRKDRKYSRKDRKYKTASTAM